MNTKPEIKEIFKLKGKEFSKAITLHLKKIYGEPAGYVVKTTERDLLIQRLKEPLFTNQ